MWRIIAARLSSSTGVSERGVFLVVDFIARDPESGGDIDAWLSTNRAVIFVRCIPFFHVM